LPDRLRKVYISIAASDGIFDTAVRNPKESCSVNTEKQKEKQKESVRMRGSIAQASELGFTVASSLLFPLLAGLWIGGQAGNRKLGAIIGALIGLLTAFGALWQMVWKRK